MKQGTGKFINRRTKTDGKLYDRFFVYIPAEVARDSAFPIEEGQEVTVKIDGDRVIVDKAEKKST